MPYKKKHLKSLRALTRRRTIGARPIILCAAFPKSASLFLLKLISEGTNFKGRNVRLSQGFGHNVIDRERFKRFLDGRSIMYGHIPCHEHNRTLIRRYDRRIIVSLRPLPEVIASLKDHIADRKYGPLDFKIGNFPEGYADYFKADDNTQLNYIIDYVMPWYFQFLVSWIEESKHSPVLWVTYEDIVGEPIETVQRVASFCGIACDTPKLELFLESKPKINFNKGVRGRGFSMLDDRLTAKLDSLAHYHERYVGEEMMNYLLRGQPLEDSWQPVVTT